MKAAEISTWTNKDGSSVLKVETFGQGKEKLDF